MGLGRVSKGVLLVAIGTAGGGAAIAVGAVGDGNTINACVETNQSGQPLPSPNVRIIDPSSQTCNTVAGVASRLPEKPISWNVVGPTGPTGPPGAEGHTLTISGQTFSLGSGRTLTINPTPEIAPLSVNPGGRPVGSLTGLDVERSQQNLEILSWSFGVTHTSATGGGGGGGAGKLKVHEIQITKTVDKSSPLLFKACATGQHFKKVTLTLRKAGAAHPYLTITMSDVLISSFQQGSTGGGKLPVESLSLNFTKVQYQYASQK